MDTPKEWIQNTNESYRHETKKKIAKQEGQNQYGGKRITQMSHRRKEIHNKEIKLRKSENTEYMDRLCC